MIVPKAQQQVKWASGRIVGEGVEVVLMTPVPKWTWRNRQYSHVPGSNVSAVFRPSKPVVRSASR